MKREIIEIAPKLNKQYENEFLIFCKELKKALKGKTIIERQEILIKERRRIAALNVGKEWHPNVDLTFVVSLLVDLLLQDWELIITKNKVRIELDVLEEKDKDLDVEKAKTRRRHLLARDDQLNVPSVIEFIKGMEKRRLTNTGWHSIFSVMRDGKELKEELDKLKIAGPDINKIEQLGQIIKPYIQFVEVAEPCAQTGLMLSDIWRYFRHTWINEYKSLPGRSMSILIRDAGAPNHPVIGIAALGSSVAQQGCRDEWIGWDGETFVKRLLEDPSGKYGKWILETIESLVNEIYLKDFFKDKIIALSDFKKPTIEVIKHLRDLSIDFKEKHIKNPHSSKFTTSNDDLSWEQRANSNLFKSKRALILSELLGIKMVFNKYNFKGTKKELTEYLTQADFRDAVQKLIRKEKSIHVGIDMMDIIVCGSLAPYNHLLGGKLVCMLLASPEVSQYYNEKYTESVSLIASSMAGKPVVRKPQLVLLGTTSLYGVGSSQYNRIKIPCEEIGGVQGNKLEYKELGVSEGFGSFHFSSKTTKLADTIVGRDEGKRVNSIFGEGANPLLRKLKDAMEYLELESNPILNHRNKRVVYGVALTENFGETLSGLAQKAKYLIPQVKPRQKTELIGRYWIKRWLANRVGNEEVIEKVSQHTLSYPISHGARVVLDEEDLQLELFD